MTWRPFHSIVLISIAYLKKQCCKDVINKAMKQCRKKALKFDVRELPLRFPRQFSWEDFTDLLGRKSGPILLKDRGNKTNCNIVHWAAGKAILKGDPLEGGPQLPHRPAISPALSILITHYSLAAVAAVGRDASHHLIDFAEAFACFQSLTQRNKILIFFTISEGHNLNPTTIWIAVWNCLEVMKCVGGGS